MEIWEPAIIRLSWSRFQMVAAQPGAAAGRQSFLRVGAHIQRVVGQQARRGVGNRRRQNGQQDDGGAYRPQGLGAAKTDYFLRPGLAGRISCNTGSLLSPSSGRAAVFVVVILSTLLTRRKQWLDYLGVPDARIQQSIQQVNQQVDDDDGHCDDDDDGPGWWGSRAGTRFRSAGFRCPAP